VRAVFDPNVLVSASISSKGPPRELLHRWAGGEFELVVSAEILFELQEVLTRPRFRGHEQRVEQAEVGPDEQDVVQIGGGGRGGGRGDRLVDGLLLHFDADEVRLAFSLGQRAQELPVSAADLRLHGLFVPEQRGRVDLREGQRLAVEPAASRQQGENRSSGFASHSNDDFSSSVSFSDISNSFRDLV
jgi:hypothetical protein